MGAILAALFREVAEHWIAIGASVIALLSLRHSVNLRKQTLEEKAQREKVTSVVADHTVINRLGVLEDWKREHMAEIIPLKQQFQQQVTDMAVQQTKVETLEELVKRVMTNMDELVKELRQLRLNGGRLHG